MEALRHRVDSSVDLNDLAAQLAAETNRKSSELAGETFTITAALPGVGKALELGSCAPVGNKHGTTHSETIFLC